MRRVIVPLWVACLCILIGLSLVPHLIKTPNDSDKYLHVVAYCVLMLCPAAAFRPVRIQFAIAAALFATGVGVEFFQYIIGGRLSSAEDALANGAGILCGLVIGRLIRSGLDASPPDHMCSRE